MAGKSILVVDTPSSCKSCKFYDEWWCKIKDRCPEDDMGENGIAIWCPLRPLPEVRDTHCHYGNWELDRIINSQSRGWNWCIDEIMGETE